MISHGDSSRSQLVIGIDVGGTKIAAGLVQLPEGRVLARRVQPTQPTRGGDAILDDAVEIVRRLQREAADSNRTPSAVGLGVAELVGTDGGVLSAATICWEGVAVEEIIRAKTGLPVRVEADVRAAACAEAQLGAGRPFSSFLYITVGTGISSCLVIDRIPYAGARGLTGTFASSRGLIAGDDGKLAAGPALEQYSAGPALAIRMRSIRPEFAGTASDVISAATSGDPQAREIVDTAGQALGAAIGQLVNVLDPEAVVMGGGLGLVGGSFRATLTVAMREHIWSDLHRDIPLLSAEMGNDAGFVGAAFAAAMLTPQATAC